MDCEHITHPEHWLGDCGDVARHFAPVPLLQAAVDATTRTMAEALGVDYDKLDPIDISGHRFPIA